MDLTITIILKSKNYSDNIQNSSDWQKLCIFSFCVCVCLCVWVLLFLEWWVRVIREAKEGGGGGDRFAEKSEYVLGISA